MIPLVPAIIPESADDAICLLKTLSFSSEIHLDVVDGIFVPFISWPFQPKGELGEISFLTDRYTLEVDLMVDKPIVTGMKWLEAGADMLVFHLENTSLAEFKAFREHATITVSISAKNSTPLSQLKPYLEYADGVQLMGIAEIGAQGQAFDERVLERIRQIKNEFPGLPVTIDGSVNETTIVKLKEAGADRFICGSAIVKAPNPALAYQTLNQLIN